MREGEDYCCRGATGKVQLKYARTWPCFYHDPFKGCICGVSPRAT